MGHEVTIGGERLGAGKKQKAYLHGYERSNHDKSFVWRSTMASGTLVPFMTELGLPGDTFDIDLNIDVLTHPTIGPLFGSYKIQVDVFQIPIRLYQAQMHMNLLGVGLKMSDIKLPQVEIVAQDLDFGQPLDNQHINPSCIFSYLGIRGLGSPHRVMTPTENIKRQFNAVPYLAYWDIYKNYYANKQEEIGAVIHKRSPLENVVINSAEITDSLLPITIPLTTTPPWTYNTTTLLPESKISIVASGITEDFDLSRLLFRIQFADLGIETYMRAESIMYNWEIIQTGGQIIGTNPIIGFVAPKGFGGVGYLNNPLVITDDENTEPRIHTFPLSNIDEMKRLILASSAPTSQFVVDYNSLEPYNLPLLPADGVTRFDWPKKYGQEGLAIKTYQSDLFNNWISTEWIDGADGISEITKIDTSSGSFTLDEFNLNKKIYEMLNRIAISGGSYDDWIKAVYSHDRQRSVENPMYIGGLQDSLIFQEVISNAETTGAPLGTLAGRGKTGGKRKGGRIVAKIDEPSYIMGIVSLTPKIDYSQGNQWDTNLKTMNDLHKPALDQIGFQDLITDQMAWFDTVVNIDIPNALTYKSAGKQPAWINYMTNINVVRGNFADQAQQMFMVLNRRYIPKGTGTGFSVTIADLTTYIDPSKFNHIFADTRRDAQNFWTQIAVNIHARRKMSAATIPNL